MIVKLLQKEISKDNIFMNEPMKVCTSFKTGGNADIYVKAKSIDEIKNVLNIVKENNIPLYIIGNGTNILVKDGGIRGIVLKIDFKDIQIEKKEDKVLIKAGAGVPLGMIAQKLAKEKITGFEFASGIPGTIGGAVRMNAGAHGSEMKDIVLSTTYMDMEGNIFNINNQEHKFEYRESVFCKKKYIILSSTLVLQYGDKDLIEEKMNEYAKYRKEKQPIEYPSAGSTFKRGDGYITAQLIDQCGLKGYSVGGAEVSTKHAGFIINKDNATSKDILDVINYVQESVYKKFNKKINLEIEILGDDEGR